MPNGSLANPVKRLESWDLSERQNYFFALNFRIRAKVSFVLFSNVL